MLYDLTLLYSYAETELVAALYFLLLLVFLLPLSIFVTLQFFLLIQIEFCLYKFYPKCSQGVTADIIFSVAKALASKRLWFKLINFMELECNLLLDRTHQYFNAIGFAYESMHQYDIAKVYYIKAVNAKKNYSVALQNLASIYVKKNCYSLALSTYQLLLAYDENNKIAKRFIKDFKNN